MERKVGGVDIDLCVCLFMACVGVHVIVSVSTICMQWRHGITFSCLTRAAPWPYPLMLSIPS